MSKPWYYTIGYPVKVLYNEVWLNGIITNGYRHEDGIITTMTEKGQVWFCETKRESYLKPNLPDDNPWIPVSEQLPKSYEHKTVFITIRPYDWNYTVKGDLYNGNFYYSNGLQVKCPVLAWKPYFKPEPYKDES